MRKKLMVVAFLLMAGPLLAAKAVLLVNGREITDSELELAKRAIRAQMRGRSVSPDEVLRHALDQLIGQAVLGEAARQAGVSVARDEVEAVLDRQRAAAGGSEAFNVALKKSGFTVEELRAFESARLLAQRYVEREVAPKVSVSPKEVREYYEQNPQEFHHEAQVKVRMILAAVRPDASTAARAAARQKAESALARVKAGEEFAQVAGELSDDPSRSKGGEVGWVRKGMLLPELEPAVLALADGEVSGVLESSYGFHVFTVDAHRPAGTYPFEEIRDDLGTVLRQRKVMAAMAAIIAEKRAAASILALDPAVQEALEAGAEKPPW